MEALKLFTLLITVVTLSVLSSCDKEETFNDLVINTKWKGSITNDDTKEIIISFEEDNKGTVFNSDNKNYEFHYEIKGKTISFNKFGEWDIPIIGKWDITVLNKNKFELKRRVSYDKEMKMSLNRE